MTPIGMVRKTRNSPPTFSANRLRNYVASSMGVMTAVSAGLLLFGCGLVILDKQNESFVIPIAVPMVRMMGFTTFAMLVAYGSYLLHLLIRNLSKA